MNNAKRFTALLAIIFFAGFIFINWFLGSRDIDHMPDSQLWIPAYVMFGITLVCTSLMPHRPLFAAPMAIAGILIGVAFDALTDRTRDRNLFPFEMIIWAGISTPGILAGWTLGAAIFWIRNRLPNHRQHRVREARSGGEKS